jgi:hypothetical protein
MPRVIGHIEAHSVAKPWEPEAQSLKLSVVTFGYLLTTKFQRKRKMAPSRSDDDLR